MSQTGGGRAREHKGREPWSGRVESIEQYELAFRGSRGSGRRVHGF